VTRGPFRARARFSTSRESSALVTRSVVGDRRPVREPCQAGVAWLFSAVRDPPDFASERGSTDRNR
jgi:hypothetical protein